MKRISLLILLAAPAMLCGIYRPPTPVASPAGEIEPPGHIGGLANAVAAQGDHLYAGLGSEMAVLDISEPTSPERVGYVLLGGIVEDVFTIEQYAYVFVTSPDPSNSSVTWGLRVVDVSNPTTPAVVQEIPMPGYVVAIVGHYVYAANWNDLKVVDISDPAAPTEMDVFSAPAPIVGMAVADGRAHVVWSICHRAACTNGVSVLDLSDPAAPRMVESLEAPVYLSEPIAIVEDHVYVGYNGGLYVMDASIPDEWGSVKELSIASAKPTSIAVVGDWAFVACASGVLAVLDVSDPGSPILVSTHRILEDRTTDMVVVASDPPGHIYAYVAGGDAGSLQVIDISNPATPFETGRYGAPGRATTMDVTADNAYIVGTRRQFWIVDVSNPSKFTQAGFHAGRIEEYSYFSGDVTVTANYAYVVTRMGLEIIDISNPSAPVSVGSYTLFSDTSALALQDDHAYVVTVEDWTHDTLRVVDVSNPAAPFEIGRVDLIAAEVWTTDIFIAGEYAYVASKEGLWIVDVSDPTRPAQVGFHETPGAAQSVMVRGNYAYVADGFSGLRIFDVTDPAAPVDAGHVGIVGWTADVAVGDGFVHALNEQEGLWVFDISNPTAPTNPRNFFIPGRPVQVAVDGDLVYVLDAVGGLYVLRVKE
jgi:hypothetical protein